MSNELQALARTIAELQEKNDNLKEIIDSKSDMLRQLLAEREVWEMNEKELKQEVEKLKRECDGLKGCNKAQAKDVTAEYELRQKAERALGELQELYTKCADDRRNARNAFAGAYRFIRRQGLLAEYNEFAGVDDKPDCVIGELDVAKNERDIAEKDVEELQNEVCDLRKELTNRLEIAQEQLEDCTKHELSEKNRQEMWDKLKLDIKANVEARNAEFFGENMEGVE